MKLYHAKNILNIALMGHAGAGKTSIAEAMLRLSGAAERLGKVSDGTTVCDYDTEEIRRKASISAAVAPMEWKGCKINLLDTPGLFDFAGAAAEAVRAADSVVIAVSGRNGVAVGTEKAVEAAETRGLAKVFFVNGLCDESARFYHVFEDLKAKFGPAVCPVVVPYFEDGKADIYINLLEYKAYDYSDGAPVEVDMPDMGDHRLQGLRTAICEAVAETSDELFEKYFSGQEFTPEEIIVGISKGVKAGTVLPVFCGDALLMHGMEQFLDGITWLLPRAADKAGEIGTDMNGDPVELAINEDAATAALCFKTIVDPFVGKVSFLKCISGKVNQDSSLLDMRTGASEHIGKVMLMRGKKQEEMPAIPAGDIGAVLKLSGVSTGDTLCAPSRKLALDGIDYPTPVLRMAIVPKKRGEEDKIAQAVQRMIEEDPTLQFENNAETHEMVISGLGEQHLDVVLAKLQNHSGVEAELRVPRIPYRETIRKAVKVQGRYKKQTGGHGQFGDVWIEFSPCDSNELVFDEKVVGGSVPKSYFPAVEKGLRECTAKGPFAGYPVVGLHATLYDGSYHPVDSSEMSFKTAAALAYRAGMPQAEPILLEPIGTLRATVPDSSMGDIMGAVTKRRGHVLGMESAKAGFQIVTAEAPEAEMTDFSVFLRQVTQGRGSFSFRFARYEPCPPQIAQNVPKQA
ncbi:MAG: elongation factor G [Oscillospiraceae bacterium]|nr:elongation factor G [Oscillospiraceae bacterium]